MDEITRMSRPAHGPARPGVPAPMTGGDGSRLPLGGLPLACAVRDDDAPTRPRGAPV